MARVALEHEVTYGRPNIAIGESCLSVHIIVGPWNQGLS